MSHSKTRSMGLLYALGSHPSRTEPNNLLSSAIAYVAQRICAEAVSAWFLPSDEPKSTTSTCWQHLGMKLTSVTWHRRKQMHQVHLEISMYVVDFVEKLKPKTTLLRQTYHRPATKQIMKIYNFAVTVVPLLE